MLAYVLLFIILSEIQFSKSAMAPFIMKCKSDDAECARASAAVTIPLFADGIPELGIEALDPAFYAFIDSSTPDLKFIITNMSVAGLKNCKPLDVRRDVSESKIFVKLSCNVDAHGRYELSGKVLGIEIEGRGAVHSILPRFEVDIIMTVVEVVGEDNKKHINVASHNFSYELKEKAIVDFENLSLDKESIEVMKNSGSDIVRAIGGPMFQASIKKIVDNVNNFFRAIPIEEFSSD